MRVREIMTRDPATVAPTDTLAAAARRMDDLNVGALPVCDGTRLVGIVTDRDVTVRATAAGMAPDAVTVEEVMTTEPDWCFEDEPVEEAERRMQDRQIRRLPVLSRDQRLVGILALGDIATDSDRPDEAAETLERISEPSRPDRAPD